MKEYSYWHDSFESVVESRESVVESPESVLLSARPDVVIVGAGYTGLSAAGTLARAGADVLVVERERI